jgi:hypothetical protein
MNGEGVSEESEGFIRVDKKGHENNSLFFSSHSYTFFRPRWEENNKKGERRKLIKQPRKQQQQ